MPPKRDEKTDANDAAVERAEISTKLDGVITRLGEIRGNLKGIYSEMGVARDRITRLETKMEFIEKVLNNRGLLVGGLGVGGGIAGAGGALAIWKLLQSLLSGG